MEAVDTINGMMIGGPGYDNNEGKPSPGARQAEPYGGGSIKFFEILANWRAEGSFEGVDFSK